MNFLKRYPAVSPKACIGDYLKTSRHDRDIKWLAGALQAAVEIEFYTIPPYLTAWWSIQAENDPMALSIREIVQEEMAHMAIACNLLVGLGFTPVITGAVPRYPGHLPFQVKEDLKISLRKLDMVAIKAFVELEAPETIPDHFMATATNDPFPTIGAFYHEVKATFETLRPTLRSEEQIAGHLSPLVMTNIDEAVAAIDMVMEQGEGSENSPADSTLTDLAHYWRFREMEEQRRYRFDPYTGKWKFTDEEMPLPETYPMIPIPAGGYDPEEHPAAAVKLRQFDAAFSKMLLELQSAWDGAGQGAFTRALEDMFRLRSSAIALMNIELPDGSGTYGPNFRLVSDPPS